MYRFRILLLTQTILQEKKKNSRMKKLRVDPGSRIKKCTYFHINQKSFGNFIFQRACEKVDEACSYFCWYGLRFLRQNQK
jgi:hypothetical protein